MTRTIDKDAMERRLSVLREDLALAAAALYRGQRLVEALAQASMTERSQEQDDD